MYNYIRSFLKGGTARFKVAQSLSSLIKISRGTPQGSIISPTLFNLCMTALSRQLSTIPNLHHTFYADDITLWCETGSPGNVETTLQKGVETIVNHLHKAGLEPSAEKSELLLMNRTHYQKKTNALIQLTLLGKQIPKVTSCRVLGFIINHNNNANSNVIQYQKDCRNLTHLMRRIISKKHGLREEQATQLVTALVYSRLLYTAHS